MGHRGLQVTLHTGNKLGGPFLNVCTCVLAYFINAAKYAPGFPEVYLPILSSTHHPHVTCVDLGQIGFPTVHFTLERALAAKSGSTDF